MHRDATGRLHLAIVVFGPWSQALGYDLDWILHRLGPAFPRVCRVIDLGEVWFKHVQCLLPIADTRPEPIHLHVSAMAGTLWSEALEQHLLRHADGILFVAEAAHYRLEAAVAYRALLDPWIAERGDAACIVYQFDEIPGTTVTTTYPDRASTTEPIIVPTPAELCALLRTGTHEWFATKTCELRDIGPPFRALVGALQVAEQRGALAERPLLAPIEPLVQNGG